MSFIPSTHRLSCEKPLWKGQVKMIENGIYGFYPVCDENGVAIYFEIESEAMRAAKELAKEESEKFCRDAGCQ